MERQGSFQLLRNLLGSIAGGLSSLASLPFAKRKAPEALPAPSPPFTDFDPDADNLSKLYPDMELSESRKRVKLSLDGMLGEKKGECSKEKRNMRNDLTGVGELSREGSGENSDVCVSPIQLNGVSYDVGAALNEGGVTAFGSVASSQGGNKPLRTYDYTDGGGTTICSVPSQGGKQPLHAHDYSDDVSHAVSHVGSVTLPTPTPYHSEIGSHSAKDSLHIPDCSDEKVVNEDDEMVHDMRDDSDDNLASFKRTLVARKMKQKKRVQDPMEEEELPRKKVRFGKTVLDLSNDAQSGLTATMPDMVALLKKSPASKKRRRADESEDKNERKLRALTLGEEPARTEGKKSTVGMSGVSTRKRERADYEGVNKKSIDDEQVKLLKAVLVENFPLNVSRKAISKEFSQFGNIESMQLCPLFFHEEKSRKWLPSSGVINQSPNSQKAHIAYKDVRSAKAALAHNMKEFKGNVLRVIAASTSNDVGAFRDDNWSIVVRNIPVDVKEKELFQLFGSIGSLKLDVKAVRVTRDPNTGFSEGIAHVSFRTEGDVNRVLSSQQNLKLRDRVLHVSRASGKIPMEQRLTPPRLVKRSINIEAEDRFAQEMRAKFSSRKDVITSTKEHKHQGRQMHMANKESNLGREHIGLSVSHGYTTRHVAASMGQDKNLEDSPEAPEAKRKREEKRQRGISRSKKIRRT